MSSLPRGFEPQTLENLGQRSLTELREMLKRQERLLRNEKFICKLPDKGKKIIDSVAKLKVAIAGREESTGKSELFHPVKVDSKVRQKVIAVVDEDTARAQNSEQILDTSSLVPGCSSVDNSKSSKTTSPKHEVEALFHKSNEGTSEAEETVPSSRASASSSSEASRCLPQRHVSSQEEATSSISDNLLIDRLQRITIADQEKHGSEENTSSDNLTGFPSGTQKKPHYMEVLEMRARNPVPSSHKFKTNVLPSQPKDSSSLSQRRVAPISSDERRQRDKKHIDDITAARLLPLHHMPTQLLSIEESLTLQKQQKQQYEEIQAKHAAQKLAEKLNIKMQSYNPEGKTLGKYREVTDEDDQCSDDEL
ncbi:PREDICTED: DNA-directed RNA polymerase II subunit GRINL1A-like [Elephantulus edwardii]|uniref:DNA-directed RNA polymerase II subunit GRINL1A-like n=1 Tax=Elephantulus edwardii TaxID=28737 RepID=UPI0003F0EB95|nr:PREDICTED: DNA-directed RNA polymerase II subunit GRINL1A-like [Elephantulus edwardii]